MRSKRIDVHLSTPLRHVEEEELEAAIKDGLSFFSVNSDAPEVEVMGQVTGINTFAEAGRRAIGERGLVIHMKDGSEFELQLMRVRGPEYEHEDQME